jgi:acetyl esterase
MASLSKPTSQMQEILDAHKAMGPLPIETLSAEIARQIPLADRAAAAVYGQNFTKRALAPMPLPVGKVQHKLVPGSNGELLTRIYTPKGDAPKGGWPVVVYFHGGGWVLATLDTYDGSCRAICDGAEAVVISVAYRQAPEHQWPAAPNDAFAAYKWALGNVSQINGNPQKIAIAGESAGGNLAAVVTLMAKEQNMAQPLHQVLIYPVTDVAHGTTMPSAQQHANAAPLNTPMLSWFYDYYVPKAADRTDPMISPLHADSLSGLPSATIIAAQIDPLLSEGEFYAKKLREAGVAVEYKLYTGVTHEFFGMAGLVSEATDAVSLVCKQLKNAFEHTQVRKIAA